MSVSTSKNNLSVMIGKNIARTASVQYTDPTGANYLADGEVLVIESDGTIMTNTSTLTTAPKFRLVQRSGSRLIYSPLITGANVKSYRGIDGSAGSEQVATYGSNGTTGSIDLTSTQDYILNLSFTFDEGMWSEQLNNYPFIVPYSSSITEESIAQSLAYQINMQMSSGFRVPEAGEGPLVRATLLSDGASAAAVMGGAVTTWTLTKDSNIIKFNGAMGVPNFAVDDYVRFDAGGSPAVTDPVYKVKEIDAVNNIVKLTFPYQGTSVTLTEATDVEFFTAGAASFGFVLTAQPLKFQMHPQGEFKYLQVSFNVGLKQGFGNTTKSVTAPVRPVNSGIQIAELEQYAEGFRGNLNRTVVPLNSLKTDANQSAVYDVINIVWYDTSDTSPVDGTRPSEQELMIAIVDGATQITNGTNGVLTVLNNYMPTTPGAFATVSL